MNKDIFSNPRPTRVPITDTINEAGGKAFSFSPEHTLAQIAATGCLNSTFYASAEQHLDKVLELTNKVSPRFIAQTAVYARERGFMKDMPALLVAILAKKDQDLLKKVFNRVIDNGKMVRNFVQIVRSGKVGQKSLNRASRQLISEWLNTRDDYKMMDASIGDDPSLAVVLKLVHAKPVDDSREAMFGWILGQDRHTENLPELVKQYEAYKRKETKEIPKVPFQLLTALPLGKEEWTAIAKTMGWHATRINLNTLKRHGVFEDMKMVKLVADRLRDPENIKNARIFPYQLMMAYMNTTDVPFEIREALQDAMEISTENIPAIDGKVYVFPDISGSMSSPVTGNRGSATSKVTCRDVAALVSAAMVRRNKTAEIIPFSDHVVPFNFNPRDSIMTIADQLRKLPSGGTNCGAPMEELVRRIAAEKSKAADLIVYVSDNQSWVDSVGYFGTGGRSTKTMEEFQKVKAVNPKAKMVLMDIQPNGTTQASERKDILNVGGFSDQVFQIMAEFTKGELGGEHWVGEIERISL